MIAGLKPFAAKGGVLIWGEANPAQSQGFRELLPPGRVSGELADKVDSLERAWRGALPVSPLEALRNELSGKGFTVSLSPRAFAAKKHFTPVQIRKWFSPEAAERPDSLLARLAAELSVRERAALEGALQEAFSGPGIEWRQAYDFLRVDFA